MSKLTIEQYERLLRRYKLVEGAQLDKVMKELVAKFGAGCFDIDIYLERLIEHRLLTLWQHQILLEGKQDAMVGGRHQGFFLGSYKLLDHIGTGGMNSVYLAEHVVMKRRVAIKVLPLTGDEDPTFLDRFRFESRAIAALDHPNIVRAHDFNNDGDVYYLVMEYIEGKDLHHLVKEKGPLPFQTAADYVRQAADGLQHAHKAGLVHRDVKPANLLVDHRKVIKVLDLGVSRLDVDDDEQAARGHCQGIVGTADYLAPEQATECHTVDGRADLYSLGCTLYFLLTGHPPFAKGTIAQRMLAHQMQEPPPIYEDRPNAPVGLVEICQKMMSKKPEDRYASASEVSKALVEWTKSYTASGEDPMAPGGRPGVKAADTFFSLSPTTTMGGKKRKKAQAQQVQGDEKITCRTCGTIFGRYMYRSKCPKCSTVNHPLASYGGYGEMYSKSPSDSTSGGTDVSASPGTTTVTAAGIPPAGNASAPGSAAAAPASKAGPPSFPAGFGLPPVPAPLNLPNGPFGQGGSLSTYKEMNPMLAQPPTGGAESGPPQPPRSSSGPRFNASVRAYCPKCEATFCAPWDKCLLCGADTLAYDGSQHEGSQHECDGGHTQLPPAGPSYGARSGSYSGRSSGGSRTSERNPYHGSAWDDLGQPMEEVGAGVGASGSGFGDVSDHGGAILAFDRTSRGEGSSLQVLAGPMDGNGQSHTVAVPPVEWPNMTAGGVAQLDEAAGGEIQTSANMARAPKSTLNSSHGSTGDGAKNSGKIKPISAARQKGARERRWVLLGALCAVAFGVLAAVAPWRDWVNGPVRERFPNGKKKLEGTLSGGLREGRWIEWYENGQKRKEGEYAEDLPTGRWVEWTPEGQIAKEGDYVRGKAHGAWTYRYPDGQIEKQGKFQDGAFRGRWVFWHPNGQKKAEVDYLDSNAKVEVAKWNEKGDWILGEQDPLKNYNPNAADPK